MWFWEIPAIVLSFLTWLQAAPVSLADAAAREAIRRQLTPKSVRALTNDDVNGVPKRPLPTLPASEPLDVPATGGNGVAGAAAAGPGGQLRDEVWWRTALTNARNGLERDLLLATALQSNINALTNEWSARDDPAQRQALYDQRLRALSELDRMNQQIDADRKALADLEEQARRENVPAGWLR